MNPLSGKAKISSASANQRLNIWYGALLIIIAIFAGRLFYLQIIQHDHYRNLALAGQQKQYSIAAERGVIRAYSGGELVPLVLNQKLYTLYVDPGLVKDAGQTAAMLAELTSAKQEDYLKLINTPNTRYVVLQKRLSEEKQAEISALKLPGVGLQAVDYRVYPQGSLASQLLGFVNTDGKGTYGLEQALNEELAGVPGLLKAITDAEGVPLAASKDNVQVDPEPGQNLVLTIDVAMQKQLENILKEGLKKASSGSGSALIIDPNSGAIKAMANWPSYNPAEYYKVKNGEVFNNAAVSSPLEVGSIMKSLTASAALDLGVIKANTSYSDPGKWRLDDHDITNIEEVGGAGTHNIADILNKSINTGATWMLMQMGGGEINKQARERWHDYMSNHFQLGKPTGVEQGYEAGGYIPNPDEGFALSLAYANTSFGQAMTATPLQMAAALSSVINGGIYYQPQLIDKTIDSEDNIVDKQPKAVKTKVVSPKVSREIISLLEYVVENHTFSPPFSDKYSVGGKTGTAQIANPAGGYYTDRYNGTYIGFVGGNKPQYVISVRVNNPRIGGYAGSAAAQPIFGDLAHMLIDNFNVPPKN